MTIVRTLTSASIVFVLLTGVVSPAAAQVIEGLGRPTNDRPGRRPAPNPTGTSQELTLTLNFTGGYDDNLGPETPGFLVDSYTPRQQGYATSGAVLLDYRRGTATRNIEGHGRAFMNRGEMTVGQPAGGSGGVQAMTSLGRRMGATLGVASSYEPTSLFNAFGPLADQVEDGVIPDVSPTQAITQQRWFSTQINAGFHRNVTSRQRLDVQYETTQRKALNGITVDSRQQSASVRHSWDPRRSLGFHFSYRLNEHRQDRLISDRPLRSQGVDASLQLERRLSATRRVGFTLGGGATQSHTPSTLEIAERDFVEPTAFGSARIDLFRSWALSADVRRDIAVLDGIAAEPFTTNMVSSRLDGRMGSRVQLALSWASSKGDSQSHSAQAFETATGTVQVQYVVASFCAVFGAFTHYEHQLQNISALTTGLPSSYNRNSVRVGMTFWLPMLGGL